MIKENFQFTVDSLNIAIQETIESKLNILSDPIILDKINTLSIEILKELAIESETSFEYNVDDSIEILTEDMDVFPANN